MADGIVNYLLQDIFTGQLTQGTQACGIHVLIVGVSQYEVALENLTTVDASFAELAKFWKDIARQDNSESFEAIPPVVKVRGMLLGSNVNHTRRDILEAIGEFVSNIKCDDKVIVHWIGHAQFRDLRDHELFLPRREPGTEILESFHLSRLTNWIGYNCEAATQVFLFDCCSADADTANDPHPPDFIKPPPVRRPQFIVVSSGAERKALGLRNGASFFTGSLIQALRSHPGDDSGTLAAGDNLLLALAAVLKETWIREGAPEYPDSQFLDDDALWWRDFIQDVAPGRDQFRPPLSQDRMLLGKIRDPSIHTCVSIREPGDLRDPQLNGSPELKRALYSYKMFPTRVWAWFGNLRNKDRLALQLSDAKAEGYQFEIEVIFPVAHKSFKLKGKRFE